MDDGAQLIRTQQDLKVRVLINFNVVLAQFLSLLAGFIHVYGLAYQGPGHGVTRQHGKVRKKGKKLLFEKKRQKRRQSLKQKTV